MKTPSYYYFVTDNRLCAYRAPVRQTKKQRALGHYTILKVPEVFSSDGWHRSNRYKPDAEGEGGIPGFEASIACGVVKRASLLEACAAVNGDILLFAPTKTSRLASKPAH